MFKNLNHCVVIGVLAVVVMAGSAKAQQWGGPEQQQPAASVPAELVGVWSGIMNTQRFACRTTLALYGNGRFVWIVGDNVQQQFAGQWYVSGGRFVSVGDNGITGVHPMMFNGMQLVLKGHATTACLTRVR